MTSLFEYKSNDKSITLTKYIGTDNNVIVPKKIDDLPVTIIGKKCFADRDDIVSVAMSDSVKEIGAEAFLNCKNVVKIELSKKITKVGNGFVSGCDHLDLLKFYSPKFSPTKKMFENCNEFLRVCYAKNSGEAFPEDYNLFEFIQGETNRYTYGYDFDYDAEEHDVKLSAEGYYYFLDDNGNAVITHGENKYNFKHKIIKLPTKLDNIPVVAIGCFAFSDLSFYSMEIPSSIQYIASLAFYNCSFGLVTFPKKINYFSPWAFGMSSIYYYAIRPLEDKLLYGNYVNMPTDIGCVINSAPFGRCVRMFSVDNIKTVKDLNSGEEFNFKTNVIENPLKFDEQSKAIYYIKKNSENGKYAVITSTLNLIDSLDELPQDIDSNKVEAIDSNFFDNIMDLKSFFDFEKMLKENYLDDYDYKHRNYQKIESFLGEKREVNTYVNRVANPTHFVIPDFIDKILSSSEYTVYITAYNFLIFHDHMKIVEGLSLKPYMHLTTSVESANNNGGIILCDALSEKNYDPENYSAKYIYGYNGEIQSGNVKYVLIENDSNGSSYYGEDPDLIPQAHEAFIVDVSPVDNSIYLPESVDGYPINRISIKVSDKNVKNIYFQGKRYPFFAGSDKFEIEFDDDAIIDNAYFLGINKLPDFCIPDTLRGHINNIVFGEGLEYITERENIDISDSYENDEYDPEIEFGFDTDESEYEDSESDFNEDAYICVYLPKSLKLIECESILRNAETLYISKNTQHKEPFNSYNKVNYYEDRNGKANDPTDIDLNEVLNKYCNNESVVSKGLATVTNDGSLHCDFVCGQELQVDEFGSSSIPNIVKAIKRFDYRDTYVFNHTDSSLPNSFNSVTVTDRTITAKYQGSDIEPYNVSLYLNDSGHLEGTCDCMSYIKNSRSGHYLGCKHVSGLANKYKNDDIFETRYYSHKFPSDTKSEKTDDYKHNNPHSVKPNNAKHVNEKLKSSSDYNALVTKTNINIDTASHTISNTKKPTSSSYTSTGVGKINWRMINVIAIILGAILLGGAVICLFNGQVYEKWTVVYDGEFQKINTDDFLLSSQIGWPFYLIIIIGIISWLLSTIMTKKKFINYGIHTITLFIGFIISVNFKNNNSIYFHPSALDYEKFERVIISRTCNAAVATMPWLLLISFVFFLIATIATFMEYKENE